MDIRNNTALKGQLNVVIGARFLTNLYYRKNQNVGLCVGSYTYVSGNYIYIMFLMKEVVDIVLHDLNCNSCNNTWEELVEASDHNHICPDCGGDAHRVPVLKFFANEDASWVREDVNRTIDPESTDKYDQEMRKNPLRSEWFKYMDHKGYQYGDGKIRKPKAFDVDRHADKVMKEHIKSSSIEVNS